MENQESIIRSRSGPKTNPPKPRGKRNNMYLLQFFEYKHLPDHLQEISRPFEELAKQLVDTLPANPETTTALRKLLEAKDCAVRAKLFKS